MESRSPELGSNPADLDGLALASMSLRSRQELLAYRVDGGVDVFRFIETGETRLRTFNIGKDGPSMSFETNVSEPLLDAEFRNLSDYVDVLPDHGSGEAYDHRKVLLEAKVEHDKSYDELAEDIVTNARKESEQLNEPEQCDTCTNCKDEQRTFDCMFCMEGGSSYTDIEGNTVKQREKGEPDPDCSTCESSGQFSPDCPTCNGCGEVIINPLVTLVNDETSDASGFRLNMAQLIADGEVDLRIFKPTQPRAWMKGADHIVVSVDLRPLLAKKASEIGIDIYQDDFHTLWGQKPLELWATTFGHLLRPIEATTPTPEGNRMSPDDVSQLINELQTDAWRNLRSDTYGIDSTEASLDEVREHGKIFDLDLDDKLMVKEYGLRLSNLMPAHQALEELIGILAQYNYRLGFTYTGIATGETGPALYVLDDAGNILQGLGAGHEAKYVLENARRTIKDAHEKGQIKPTANEFDE